MYRWFGTHGALTALGLGLVSGALVSLLAMLIGGRDWALAAGCWSIGATAGYILGRLHADTRLLQLF